MRKLGIVTAAIVASLTAGQPAAAPRESVEVQLAAETLEVLVFETEGCLYCRIFRRDVVPQYNQSKRAALAPIRFIDPLKTDVSRLGLRQPVTMLPTIVVMRDGQETGRISGYMGPEPFFHMLSQIVRSTP